MEFQVVLCGLTDHKAHLIKLVVASARAAGNKHSFRFVERHSAAHIAIVETLDPECRAQFAQVQRHSPKVVPIVVSEEGHAGSARFPIARRTLLVQIRSLLERVATGAILDPAALVPNARPEPVTPAAPAPAAAPVAASTSPVRPAMASGPHQPGTARTNIIALVVDDSLTARAQVHEALRRSGIHCREAESADEALRELEQRSFDFALFDVVMPGVSGYDLCRKVKHDPRTRTLPVLMLTSQSSPFDRARGALAGCDLYLSKPIVWESFYAAIEKVLAKIFHNDPGAMAARGFRSAASASQDAGAFKL
jgi:two-component system, cell cycle response regulator